jgi:hypothetical protein
MRFDIQQSLKPWVPRVGGFEPTRASHGAPHPARVNAKPLTRGTRHLASLLLLAMILCGCHSAKVEQPLTGSTGGAEPEQQMEFWHKLNDLPVACNDDAFHALLLFADGKDESADYAARVANLQKRGWLSGSFGEPADQAATRGKLAVLIAHVLDIKGGLTMRIGGGGDRYALRELQYVGIFPPSSPNQLFTGPQLVAVIGRAEDYQRRKQPSQ